MRPYGRRVSLGGKSAVIDGPALAFHILGLCRKSTASAGCVFDEPSYRLLGETALAWLDHIQACGVTVSFIFLDGFLPEAKRVERMIRVARSTKMLETYSWKHPRGCAWSQPVQPNDAPVDLLPQDGRSAWCHGVPVPPFLVPVILERLLSSKKYGLATKVMPGEADVFLAKHVRSHGGLVLSSDSDFLVHDLGPNGAMVFLKDLEKNSRGPTPSLLGLEYVGQDICRQLGINRGIDMVRVAFEVETHPKISLKQAVRNFASATTPSVLPESYGTFVSQYDCPKVGPDSPGDPITLDPRISELVLLDVGAKAQDDVVMYCHF